ncbi:hypothetical protein HY970_02255 [Candidatus Kaiserbacteria bacterium]|nr:hypothetical protein [Candidatus Kaiserbacteria bacterium]
MKKVDTWLNIQNYVRDASGSTPVSTILVDVEFLARIDPIRKPTKRNWFTRRRLR